ncbi:MAG: hypothetical protein SNH55_05455 [Rikenellaceae bacterium]
MVFLFPTEFEAAPFRKLHPSANVIICGVGMAATAATLSLIITTTRPKAVILCGIAGAYDINQNPIDQVVEVISEQIEELPEMFQKIYEIEPRWGLPTASSNTVNRSNFQGAKSDIENMEGAAAAAICLEHNIQFSQIRAISNLVGDPTHKWSFKSAIKALTEALSTIYTR